MLKCLLLLENRSKLKLVKKEAHRRKNVDVDKELQEKYPWQKISFQSKNRTNIFRGE